MLLEGFFMAHAPAYGQPGRYDAPLGTHVLVFEDDGLIPNSPLPLVIRQGAVTPDAADPPKSFERLFAKNGWTNSWRDGVFDYHHYHSNAHEVLGVATGSATIRFGGENGETFGVSAGDVVIIPAGVGHACIKASEDFFCVGAYDGGRDYDIMTGDPGQIAAARQRIAAVPTPGADPVDGASGPLMKLWSA
jgi:uncharacterized protein YjlB